MARTTCPHCEGTRFEIKDIDLENATYKAYSVQCIGCGVPFNTMPFHDTNTKVDDLEKKINEMDKKLTDCLNMVSKIHNHVNKLSSIIP